MQKLVRFDVPEARRLENLAGNVADLRNVIEYCSLIESYAEDHSRRIEFRALCEAAVVRYARCFASGVRQSLPHSILDDAPPRLRESHEYLLKLRSLHIAHSVSDLEQNKVVLVMQKLKGRYKPWNIGEAHARADGLSARHRYDLPALCNWLLTKLELLQEKERDKLFRLALQFKASELSAGGMPQDLLKITAVNAHRKPRKQ